MKSLVSEQRGPLSLGIPGRIGRAKDPCDAARKHRKSVTTRICRFTHARGDITGVLRSPRYALACRRSAGLLLRNQAHHCLRKHPERSAAAHMSFHRPCQPRAVEGRFRWQVERRRPSTTRLDACAPMRSAQDACAFCVRYRAHAASGRAFPRRRSGTQDDNRACAGATHFKCAQRGNASTSGLTTAAGRRPARMAATFSAARVSRSTIDCSE